MSIKTRLAASLVVATTFFVIAGSIAWYDYSQGIESSLGRKTDPPGQEAACNKIRAGELPSKNINCDPEYLSNEPNPGGQTKWDSVEIIVSWTQDKKICDMRARGAIGELLYAYQCAGGIAPANADMPTKKRFKDHLEIITAYSMSIAAVLFVGLSLIRKYLTEPSIGWKRLSLVATLTISAISSLYVYIADFSGDSLQNALITLSIGIPLSFGALLYSRTLWLWMHAGFNADSANGNSN